MAILFANNAEALMGSTEDPPDGGAVARTCIGAVIVYSVSSLPHPPRPLMTPVHPLLSGCYCGRLSFSAHE
jgi:hypothetical protein